MAAIAEGVQTVNITVNETEIAVPKGELIVEAVKRLGLEIPIFCYHPRMKPVGMCRMCLVEVGFKQPDGSVRKMPKPQAGCTLPASEGMVIYTDTEMVHRDRKGVLEFLLINHPLDCPICDRGGECPLQNNTLFYGPSTSRFVELKRHQPKAFPLSQYVTLDLERCIQCGRCVRFTEEISGDSQLAFRFRGASMQPSTFELRTFESNFSGNVIEICPVGALTSTKYRFRARPWDLETRPAVCTLCSNGCNVYMDYRTGKVVRVNGRTNEAINEEWTCDKGKFGHDFYNREDRPVTPLVRQGDQLVPSEWAQAYNPILRAFTHAGGTGAVLASSSLSNEDLYLLQRLFREQFESNHIDHRFEKVLQKRTDTLEVKLGIRSVQSTIASLENDKVLLSFGTSLADEEPIIFLRVRKAWFKNGAKIIVAHHEGTDLDSFAHVILRYRAGTEAALAHGIASIVKGSATVDQVVAATGVSKDALTEAVAVLKDGATVLSTHTLDRDAAESLAVFAKETGGKFNNFGLTANDFGARTLGILPDTLPGGAAAENPGLNTHEILQGCIDGSVKALWLAGVDPFLAVADQSLVERALENVEFLVVQDHSANLAIPYASVVLPMAAPAEADGTYTNVEGRIQSFKQVFAPKGEAKAAWRTYSELALRIKPGRPFFNTGEVREAIEAEIAGFGDF
ncbi:MAG: NADH-quinone oxidoreductase subunit NuoG [Fimbriimonas sp.]